MTLTYRLFRQFYKTKNKSRYIAYRFIIFILIRLNINTMIKLVFIFNKYLQFLQYVYEPYTM